MVFYELPYGYFYKGKFYTEFQCFNALKKDGEVFTHRFDNGYWLYENITYRTLEELYECNDFGITYQEFKRCYKALGILFNPSSCTMYSYERDTEQLLYNSKSEVLTEIEFNTDLIESDERREERYIDNLSKIETIVYLKKSIKDRIKILEEFKNE